MGGYIPHTANDKQYMLAKIGLQDAQQLFSDIPAEMRCVDLDLPQGKSELEVRRIVEAMAGENRRFKTIFRGAGAYRHYIPAIVKQVSAKESFVTAYTPYQAEISQGILQAIFEYQTEICELTGMDVSNASIYDGASAAAEATIMCRERRRQRVLVAGTSNPRTRQVIATYCSSGDAPLEVLPEKDGLLDMEALKNAVDEEVACLCVQSPNYYGLLEDVDAMVEICHAAGVKVIYGANAMSLALFKTPAESGADIAVGDAQPFGLPLAFGGPYLGFMACTKAMMRRLPGRIVGQTVDADGNDCFVLTLQAREQHIRREKASSSVCSNQALCALTATVYLAAMGPHGVQEAASQCYAKAHYAAKKLAEAGFARRHKGEFFHEFVSECPADPAQLMDALARQDILGGLQLPDGGILWCCTEMNTKEEIDRMAAVCKEVAGK